MKSPEYALGLTTGIICALIILVIVWKINKKLMKGKFDERQELVRGRGYKYACFTLLIMLALDLLAEAYDFFDASVFTREIAIFFMIIIGVMVYAVYCIKNDSYFGIGTDTRTYRVVMWILIVSQLIKAAIGFIEGVLVNGKLDFGTFSSLLFVAAFMVIMAALYVRKRQADAEESDEAAGEGYDAEEVDS